MSIDISDRKRSEVHFVADLEPMGIYHLDDGTVIKAKSVLMHVERIEGAFHPDGSPIYNMTWQPVVVAVSPDEIKRKP